ncbi:regulatory subunit of type II PKA R-subunit domain containing 1 [Rhinolophus ferrumequinum]|uniref:Regulatory subunit of type II PKA R-subunit domain containing 1 n=1 Tax=Rhinolophus ferrumequinum TaxID=59479 RepID=A0A7J7SYZ4_RHIFE|nr:regulatory subunit of type II PKA R-subunit domain containing 1 [Rhinolophus ferrumequinum]
MATLEGGLLNSDPGALSPAQLEQLRNFKIQTRIANEKYLRTHKEVDLLISGFFREMFLQRPDNIREFAAGCEFLREQALSLWFVTPRAACTKDCIAASGKRDAPSGWTGLCCPLLGMAAQPETPLGACSRPAWKSPAFFLLFLGLQDAVWTLDQ